MSVMRHSLAPQACHGPLQAPTSRPLSPVQLLRFRPLPASSAFHNEHTRADRAGISSSVIGSVCGQGAGELGHGQERGDEVRGTGCDEQRDFDGSARTKCGVREAQETRAALTVGISTTPKPGSSSNPPGAGRSKLGPSHSDHHLAQPPSMYDPVQSFHSSSRSADHIRGWSVGMSASE